MAQRPAGIDLAGLVQKAARPVPPSASPAKTPQADAARPWRIIAPDDAFSEKTFREKPGPAAHNSVDPAVLAAVAPAASRFRDIDRQLGQLISRWPKLPPEVRSAVMVIVEKATVTDPSLVADGKKAAHVGRRALREPRTGPHSGTKASSHAAAVGRCVAGVTSRLHEDAARHRENCENGQTE